MTKFYETVLTVLKQDNRFFTEEGVLLRNAVYEAAMQMDTNLIHLLLANDTTKGYFFKEVDGIAVFDKVGFGWVVNNREFLPDSYTRFKNKIGLNDEAGSMISTNGNVELVFPYKDCVLEGGQTSEEQRRGEIFYNETLAPDEVDRLLFPKVFRAAVKYQKGDCCDVTAVDVQDNLIIKGNNLLVLHSLKRRFLGEIKCIYIDPPYYFVDNKSADTFGYNSNFKLSTWLTFMKDRLRVSKDLLSPDGSIWISVGKDGQHYLKLLADEIFGNDCFVADISWQKTYSPRNDALGISSEVESILVYSKKPSWQPNKLERTGKMNSVYKNPDNDVCDWRTSDAFAPGAFNHQGMVYAIQHPYTGELIYPYKGAHWPLKQESMFEEISKWADYELRDIDDGEIRSNICGVPIEEDKKHINAIMLAESLTSAKEKVQQIYARGQWPKFFFTKNGKGGIARKTYLNKVEGKVVTNFWSFADAGHTDEAKKEIVAIFEDKVFETPKPEKLIEQILKVATNENDLILDYHLGSGTTCAVAHKMQRRYIGVDQMDYIETIAVNRLRSVISGDQCGISESVNWKGGGSFIYCELAKANQNFVDEIQTATTVDAIKDIYNRIIETGFISSKVNPKDIDDNADDFYSLSIDDQKRFLMELLDKNLLYVNYCDIDDEEYGISAEDKAFTRSFYGEV